MSPKKAVVLISGGLDSRTTLAIAQNEGYVCHALSFDYGQRHKAELQAANKIAMVCDVPHHLVTINIGSLFTGSALTDITVDVPAYTGTAEIPVTYVPARNSVFLSIALGFAEVIEAYDIFIGVSAIDYSHYPDCRPAYISAFRQMANLATKSGVEGREVNIHTPLIKMSKAETILTGLELGVDYGQTISCYQADDSGRACGYCDSCTLRKKGFTEAHIPDPTRYR